MDEDQRKKNSLMAMTCLGEPKVESAEVLEVDNLTEVETLLEDMIREIPVLVCPIVTDQLPQPVIRETSLAVEKRNTSMIDNMQP